MKNILRLIGWPYAVIAGIAWCGVGALAFLFDLLSYALFECASWIGDRLNDAVCWITRRDE